MSGAVTTSEAQIQAFRNRVKRIEKKGGKIEIAPIGPADEQVSVRSQKRTKRKVEAALEAPKPKEKVSAIVMLFAFILGAAAVVAARYGRAEWLTDYLPSGLTGEHAGLAMGADFVGALVIAMVLKLILGARSSQFVAAQTVGAGVMVLAMHNLVHANPGLWSLAFPPAWVNEVTATTEPHSILITGISFQL